MTARYVLGPREERAPLALGEHPRTWGDFVEDVARVARGLDEGNAEGRRWKPGAELMVACSDRYVCAVTVAAIWSRGYIAALPPNARRETVIALCESRGVPAVLHDGEAPLEAAETQPPAHVDVRTWLTPEPGSAESAPQSRGATRGSTTAWRELAFDAERALVTVYTSGSTGAHVACVKTAGQLLGEASLHVREQGLGPTTRLLATVPPQHIYGLLFSVLCPLLGGGAFVRATPHHAETIAAAAARYGANVLCSVPVHLQGLALAGEGAPTLPRLDRIISSGAPLPSETARGLFAQQGRAVLELLGSSETGGLASRERGAPETERDAGSPAAREDAHAWRPLSGVSITAGNDDAMLVRSPFIAASPNGLPYQGADRIKALPDGRFVLLGRADGILKIGGSRVSVSEIEAKLRTCPGVTDAAVLAVDVVGSRGHELWAVVAGRGLTVPVLRVHLLRHVEAVAVPRRFRIVDALPREATGKLTRESLRALFGEAAATSEKTSVRLVAPASAAIASPLTGTPAETRATFSFPASSRHFAGHFDDFPLLPGIVQLNELAIGTVRKQWPTLGRLARVTALKFKSPIRPGEAITLEAKLLQPTKVSFSLRRGDEVVGQGTLFFAAGGSA